MIKSMALRNIKVTVLQLGNLNLTSPVGKQSLNMAGTVAEVGRDLLVERMQSGLARAKAAGTTLGRPAKTTDAGREEIIARHQQGTSISELARIHNMSRISIARIVRSK
jgi:putative DNA-invertase from lambdoid prophage Rac